MIYLLIATHLSAALGGFIVCRLYAQRIIAELETEKSQLIAAAERGLTKL